MKDAVFAVAQSVVAEAQVDGGQKFTINIRQVLVQSVVLYGFLGELGVSLAEQLIVDTDAVVGEGLSVAIVDAFADIQKFEVVVDCFFVSFDVVVKHTD